MFFSPPSHANSDQLIQPKMINKPEFFKTSASHKICPIETLSALSLQYQEGGKTVVLAHGVFDLVHLGHIRHLEAAKRHGDVLLVTVTADRFVNKGPDRPVFSENLRAEMLAAIEMVDFVAINPAISLTDALHEIRPNIYVKGSDYLNAADDLTGNIDLERQVVEKHGGQVLFTDEITFSSSNIINQHLDVYDTGLKKFLEGCRENGLKERLFDLVNTVQGYNVLVVGDAIIDDYCYVEALGRSSKEHMISTRFIKQEIFAGGVFAAANHIANFCCNVDIITSLGSSEFDERIIRQSLKPNVSLHHVVRPGMPTTRKTRYIEPGYFRKLFEVYDFDDSPLDTQNEHTFQQMIVERAAKYDLVVVTDFGHGLISDASIELLNTKSRFLAANAQTNSANVGFNLITKYRGADYICIDAPETRLAVGDNFNDIQSIIVNSLVNLTACKKVIVTHGKHGCVTFESGGSTLTIPAFTKTVIDTVGAGDAFLAVTSPLAAAGGDITDIGFIGNAAGALKVGILGHRASVEKSNLLKFINSMLT